MPTRRTLGFIENEWTCPNCSTRNKGSLKTCQNCGAPQPENVKFELPSEQKLVTDEAAVKAAQAGADIHCGFCGTRNPATAKTCSQCGADLTQGKARQAGAVMQAPPSTQPKIIKCERCGTENPGSNAVCSNCGSPLPKAAPTAPVASAFPAGTAVGQAAAPKKPNWLLIGGGLALLLICCVAVVAALTSSRPVKGTVTGVHWETYVPVQEIQPVNHSNERGNPPSDAYDVSCHNEDKEVCEEKTIDRGNGYSEKVQDCHTETEQYCSYKTDEWTTVQTYTLDGSDLNPVYDTPSIASDQRLGDESEKLTVTFATNNGEQTYQPSSVSEFQQFKVGSTWTLKINKFRGVIGVEQ